MIDPIGYPRIPDALIPHRGDFTYYLALALLCLVCYYLGTFMGEINLIVRMSRRYRDSIVETDYAEQND